MKPVRLQTLHLYLFPHVDEKGRPVGVPGTVELLNSKKLADQPIVGFDWNQDKMGLACMCALDQTVKVVIVTRLQNY